MMTPLVLALLLTVAEAAIEEDLVTHLPGYVHPDGSPKPLPTRHWSGYIEVPVPANRSAEPPSPSGSAFVHYWLVENAAKDPNAPTLVWQQGGPGGSSLIGLFTEVGPITLNDHSFANESATPTVFDNPFSWHTSPANMLFVEHPAPTGFSYCVPLEACTWDDENQVPTYLSLSRALSLCLSSVCV